MNDFLATYIKFNFSPKKGRPYWAIFLNTVLFSFKLSGTFITLWLEDPLHSNVGLCSESTYCPSTKTSTYFKASFSFRSISKE